MLRSIDNLGRLVIPMKIRKKLNIQESDLLSIDLENDKIIITKHIETENKCKG